MTTVQETPLPDEATPDTAVEPTPAPVDDAQETAEPDSAEIPAHVLRDRLTRANTEAAGYRVRLRELETKLADIEDPAEIRAALDAERIKTAELELGLARAEIAAKYDLHPDVAAVLSGSDRDALDTAGKTLAAHLASTEPEAVSGGLDPSTADDDGPDDPRALARLYGPRIH